MAKTEITQADRDRAKDILRRVWGNRRTAVQADYLFIESFFHTADEAVLDVCLRIAGIDYDFRNHSIDAQVEFFKNLP